MGSETCLLSCTATVLDANAKGVRVKTTQYANQKERSRPAGALSALCKGRCTAIGCRVR